MPSVRTASRPDRVPKAVAIRIAIGIVIHQAQPRLMVVIALVLLVERYDTILFTLAACVIIGREIVISALREWMAELGERTSPKFGFGGVRDDCRDLGLIGGAQLGIDTVEGCVQVILWNSLGIGELADFGL